MKSFSKFARLALLLAAVGEAGSASGTGDAAAASTASTAVPESNTADASAAKARAPKDPAKVLNILNGRLPLPLVFAIRFKEDASLKAADLAKKYGTSVGKVFDIRKGSNFGYIDANYLPSAEELAAARAHITTGTSTKGQNLTEIGGDPVAIEAHLAGMTVATPEQVAARGWQIKQVGEAKPVDPNAPAKPARTSKPKAAAAPAAPVAQNNAAMF